MRDASYCWFATPLGTCGIAWTHIPDTADLFAVSLFQLPEATAEMTEARIARHCGVDGPSEPPAQIAAVIERVRRHLNGDLQDFCDIPVDLSGRAPFVQKVCQSIRQIPAGQTITYSEVAARLGDTSLARAVGRALGKNPIPVIIPCHRVLAAGGKPGGFSAHGGRATKAKLLAIEGAVVNLCLDLKAEAQ